VTIGSGWKIDRIDQLDHSVQLSSQCLGWIAEFGRLKRLCQSMLQRHSGDCILSQRHRLLANIRQPAARPPEALGPSASWGVANVIAVRGTIVTLAWWS
jgi:hypothetical protein